MGLTLMMIFFNLSKKHGNMCIYFYVSCVFFISTFFKVFYDDVFIFAFFKKILRFLYVFYRYFNFLPRSRIFQKMFLFEI